MTVDNPASSGSISLRPRARLLHTFGDELISSDSVAIIELVKNSYDADATRVLIRFENPLEPSEGKIEVIDNGSGMTLETIKSSWFEPATPFRKQNSITEKKKRRVLGEKGIGRFASSRIADQLEVFTRQAGAENEVRAFLNWKQFDDDSKYLDDIKLKWEVVEPTELCSEGTLRLLCWDQESEETENTKGTLSHGTILRMTSTRTEWDTNKFKKLRSDLSRLVSPFFIAEREQKGDTFEIMLDLPEPYANLSGLIEPPETLKHPHYRISGDVQESGDYDFDLYLYGESEPTELKGIFTVEEKEKPSCGPFHLELRVWDRDPQSLKSLAGTLDKKVQELRSDIDDAAGINVFRDGFRVLPYGEPGNDWLQLDKRRFMNPTMRISNNQVVGQILISADNNRLLVDLSNREGLITGRALSDLQDLILSTITQLEKYRYNIRHPKTKSEKPKSTLFQGFNLQSLRDEIKSRYPQDTELISIIDDKEKDMDRGIDHVQVVLSRYQRLATLGRLIDNVLHEGQTPLAKIINEATLGVQDISKIEGIEKTKSEKIKNRFKFINQQSGAIYSLFHRIAPFGGRKKGKPGQMCLETAISNAFSILDSEIQNIGAQVTLPESCNLVTVDSAEIQEVILNLLDNSLYWLRKVPKEQRRIAVHVERKNEKEIMISFSDSGPGIEPEFQDKIFEPYFSTKSQGIGLGLSIAGEIVQDYYDGSLELIDNSELGGASFRITLRRRV